MSIFNLELKCTYCFKIAFKDNDINVCTHFTIACTYSGTTYVFGQVFVGDDGCSRCYCGANGEVTCDNTPCSKSYIR